MDLEKYTTLRIHYSLKSHDAINSLHKFEMNKDNFKANTMRKHRMDNGTMTVIGTNVRTPKQVPYNITNNLNNLILPRLICC